MKIFIGYDSREPRASEVAIKSLHKVSGNRHDVQLLEINRLRTQGLYTRPTEDHGGQLWDVISDAPMSTEFAISRFLVPIIARGPALFVDADVVFREDPERMPFSPAHAVSVVPHVYEPSSATKMAGQMQSRYWRKNWSSVMLFNCDHPAHTRLTLNGINTWPGRALHHFCWLRDDEIGALPPRWNWLVGEQPEPPGGHGIAHFTLGGPFTPGWTGGPFDELWNEATGS